MNLLSNIIVIAILIIAVVFDIKKRIIPDALVIIGSAIGIVMLFLNTEITYLSALAGAVIAGGVLLVISLVSKGAFGMGDVKLIVCLSIFIGLEKLIGALFIAFIASGLVGLIFLVRSRKNAKKEIPFAPFLLVGTLVTLFF